MSKSTTKKILIQEALRIYNRTMSESSQGDDYHLVLCKTFNQAGWIIRVGAEKGVAVKGSVVAKWCRPNHHNKTPIRAIYRLYRNLDAQRRASLHPRIYVRKHNFMIEQFVDVWDELSDVDAAIKQAEDVVGLFAFDITEYNIGWINNKLKIFDARLSIR